MRYIECRRTVQTSSVVAINSERGATGGREAKGVTWKVSTSPHFSWSLTEQKGAEGEKGSTRERRRGVAPALGSCSSSLFHWLFFRSCVTILMNQFLFLT